MELPVEASHFGGDIDRFDNSLDMGFGGAIDYVESALHGGGFGNFHTQLVYKIRVFSSESLLLLEELIELLWGDVSGYVVCGFHFFKL